MTCWRERSVTPPPWWRGGVDGLLVENFGDRPFFPRSVPPETVAAMALAVAAVRRVAGALPVGVNVLRNDARSALGLCAATGARFLRVNVHCGAMVTDQGLLQGAAHRTLRERARLAPDVSILADVHVKHAAPLGSIPIATAARDLVERGLADAVIVTGDATGVAPDHDDLERVREAIGSAPLIAGSGVRRETVAAYCSRVDGVIVGTDLKREGRIGEPVDPSRVRELRRRMAGAGGDPA